MLVYKKGKLTREVTPLSNDTFEYKLNHLDSGVSIFTTFKKGNKEIGKYKVVKEVDGKYVIFEQFTQNKKETILDTFKRAIAFFESSILKELVEKPQNPTPPNDNQEDQDKFTKTPEVGDIVQVNGEYGSVVDVDGTKVKFKTLSKVEAENLMKIRKNQLLQEATVKKEDKSLEDITSDVMARLESGNLDIDEDGKVILKVGGEIQLEDGDSLSTIKELDANDVKFTIFNVSVPQEREEGEPTNEPTPDNIREFDPDEDDMDENEDDDSEKNDEDDRDENDEESEDDDVGDDEDGDEDGDEDSDEDGDENGDEEDDQGTNDELEDEFGDDNNEVDLDKFLDELEKEIKKGEKLEEIQINNDIEAIERFLGFTSKKIKSQFKNVELAQNLIGKDKIFNSNNEQRITKALDKIFR